MNLFNAITTVRLLIFLLSSYTTSMMLCVSCRFAKSSKALLMVSHVSAGDACALSAQVPSSLQLARIVSTLLASRQSNWLPQATHHQSHCLLFLALMSHRHSPNKIINRKETACVGDTCDKVRQAASLCDAMVLLWKSVLFHTTTCLAVRQRTLDTSCHRAAYPGRRLSALQRRTSTFLLRLNCLLPAVDAQVRNGFVHLQHVQFLLYFTRTRASSALTSDVFALILSCWKVLTTSKVIPCIPRLISVATFPPSLLLVFSDLDQTNFLCLPQLTDGTLCGILSSKGGTASNSKKTREIVCFSQL